MDAQTRELLQSIVGMAAPAVVAWLVLRALRGRREARMAEQRQLLEALGGEALARQLETPEGRRFAADVLLGDGSDITRRARLRSAGIILAFLGVGLILAAVILYQMGALSLSTFASVPVDALVLMAGIATTSAGAGCLVAARSRGAAGSSDGA